MLVPNMISPEKIRFRAKITDNTEIRKDSILITFSKNIVLNQNQTVFEMRNDGDNYYIMEFTLTNSTQSFISDTYEFTIIAKDVNGYETKVSRKFRII